MPQIKEVILFLDGTSRRETVQELGFHLNNYLAKYQEHKLVWSGSHWKEY